jgi:DNA sulfur modification protein DndD
MPPAGIEIEIGKVLHPQISEFFLFDGELLETFYERLSTERERALIKDSIEAVLGIPALQIAKRDVGELAGLATSKMAKLIENRAESEKIQKNLASLKDRSESVEADRKVLVGKIREAEIQLRETREKLSAIEGLQGDVREQETLEAQISDGEREEETLKSELRKLLASGWKSVASQPLERRLSLVALHNSAVAEHNQRIEQVRSRVSALEDTTKGGVCPTCSQALPPPSDQTAQDLHAARGELESLMQETGGGSMDLPLERKLGSLIDKSTIPTYLDKYDRLANIQMIQYERRQRLDSISDRLKGHSAADIRALGTKAASIEKATEELRRAQDENNKLSDKIAKDQAKLARGLQKLPGGAGTPLEIESAFYRYVEELLDETIDAYREEVRYRVEEDATSMFLRLIRDPEGYKGLEISSDYQIGLLSKAGELRPTSQGGKQLLALSLIGALKRSAVRGGPVVLDSPLGRLDLEHRENVLKEWIPSLGTQVVLLIQDGELTKDGARQVLGNKVGRSYEILRPDNDPEVAIIERMA